MSENRILRLPEVLNRIGVSRATLHRMVQAQTFPAPCKITSKSTGWTSAQIDAWIAGREKVAASAGRKAQA